MENEVLFGHFVVVYVFLLGFFFWGGGLVFFFCTPRYMDKEWKFSMVSFDMSFLCSYHLCSYLLSLGIMTLFAVQIITCQSSEFVYGWSLLSCGNQKKS